MARPRRPAAGRQAGRRHRLREQVLEHAQAAVEPDVVRRAQRPARQRQERAVGAHERKVGLRVAAVDGEDDGALTAAPASAAVTSVRSSSSSARRCSHCPISGCASSALRATRDRRSAPPPRRAARRPRRAATRPSSSGASGALGQRRGAVGADARRHLDDVVVREPGERRRRCARRRRASRRRRWPASATSRVAASL